METYVHNREVVIDYGVPEVEQRHHFQNGTLQGATTKIAFTVATYIDLEMPEDSTERDIADVLTDITSTMAAAINNFRHLITQGTTRDAKVKFEVVVGPAEGEE